MKLIRALHEAFGDRFRGGLVRAPLALDSSGDLFVLNSHGKVSEFYDLRPRIAVLWARPDNAGRLSFLLFQAVRQLGNNGLLFTWNQVERQAAASRYGNSTIAILPGAEMGIKLGGKLGRLLLQAICKRPPDDLKPTWALDLQLAVELDPSGIPKLQRRLGVGIWDELRDRSVLDFGCGWGEDAVAAAVRGAKLVIGVDVQEHRLEAGRALAAAKGVSDRCLFINAATQAAELANLPMVDVVYAIDSFEHFDDPKGVLSQMYRLLAPGGRLLVVFGPPWKNPYGSHLEMMSWVPWIHLLFTEETVMAMRARFRADGARTYAECPGGLNGMTVRRFHELVIESGFQIEHLRTVPLSTAYTNSTGLWMRIFRTRWLVEYCTSIVIARAIRPFAEPTDPYPKPTTTDTKAEIEGASAHAICSAGAAQFPRQDTQLQAPSAVA